MRDYAMYFNDRKNSRKRGVSVCHDVDWWMEYLAGYMAKLLFLFLLFVLFLLLKSFWKVGKDQQSFPIQQITINGDVLITQPKDIQNIIDKFENKSFFTLDIHKLENEIANLAWVEKVNVTRQWSNSLLIDLEERQAAYRWGKDELIDNEGNRFANVDKKLFAQLPQLDGKAGYETKVIVAYEDLMEKLGDSAENLGIESFVLNKYLSWELHLQSGIVVKFGRDNFQQRLNRFVDAYQLGKIPNFNQIDGLDFRYPNAFTVRWKPDYLPMTKSPMVKVTEQI